MIAKEPIYIIIPVHNRKNTTLKCLETLKQNGDLQRYYIVVVDDGSTDGTAEAIHSLYPSVIILTGDGNLWWTGAIKKGMEYAYNHSAEYLIWLNDDCYPKFKTIQKILNLCQKESKTLVSALCLDPTTFVPSYGGITTHRNKIESVDSYLNIIQYCDGLNGNLMILPRGLVDTIGYPDNQNFPHHYGDFIYTNLAQKKGYKLILDGSAIAFCEKNIKNQFWSEGNYSISKVIKNYFNPKSQYYWKVELSAYKKILGLLGLKTYLFERIIKTTLIFIFSQIFSKKMYLHLRKIYQKLKSNKS
jgi:GT2 family glycosyltransferase